MYKRPADSVRISVLLVNVVAKSSSLQEDTKAKMAVISFCRAWAYGTNSTLTSTSDWDLLNSSIPREKSAVAPGR
jgi:hypothetical protein